MKTMKFIVVSSDFCRIYTLLISAVDALSRAIQKDDGRKDLVERKICNL